MPEFVISIWDDEQAYAGFTPAQWGEVFAAHAAFAASVAGKGGTVLQSKALQPTASAVSVRRGGHDITSGPFFEAAEPFCGWYLIEARDMDHAVDIAKGTPARFGGVEVRPVRPAPARS